MLQTDEMKEGKLRLFIADNYEMLDAANSIFAQVKDLHLTD